MGSNYNGQRSSIPAGLDNVNPLALLVPVLIVGIVVLLLSRRRGGDAAAATSAAADGAGRKGGDPRRRLLLTFAINALENDMLRRGIIMGLKMARSRA